MVLLVRAEMLFAGVCVGLHLVASVVGCGTVSGGGVVGDLDGDPTSASTRVVLVPNLSGNALGVVGEGPWSEQIHFCCSRSSFLGYSVQSAARRPPVIFVLRSGQKTSQGVPAPPPTCSALSI